jgi:hypothetical protein
MALFSFFNRLFSNKIENGIQIVQNGTKLEYLPSTHDNLTLKIDESADLAHVTKLLAKYTFVHVELDSNQYEKLKDKLNVPNVTLNLLNDCVFESIELDSLMVHCKEDWAKNKGPRLIFQVTTIVHNLHVEHGISVRVNTPPEIWTMEMKGFIYEERILDYRRDGVTRLILYGTCGSSIRGRGWKDMFEKLVLLEPFDTIEIRPAQYQKMAHEWIGHYGINVYIDAALLTNLCILAHMGSVNIPLAILNLRHDSKELKEKVQATVSKLGLNNIKQTSLKENCAISILYKNEILQNKAEMCLVDFLTLKNVM